MQINVATLLQEKVGSKRELAIENELIQLPEFEYSRKISGSVNLLRIKRGILVSAEIDINLELQCARCLNNFESLCTLQFNEEYVPSEPHPITSELTAYDQEDFLIDKYWHLDLSEAIRQYEQTAVPLVPLCKSECVGLDKGINFEAAQLSDDRWAALSVLAKQLEEEESNGIT
ncbi:MAG: hypothetical protein CL792_05665 [Chloroflexi bacterium]|nr:hypothetical protein [Chloroflexota bacterium]|tara:strand:- start:8456 stop:8977 length:522 start_codon:yes stop_codon:yes gene_type:complete